MQEKSGRKEPSGPGYSTSNLVIVEPNQFRKRDEIDRACVTKLCCTRLSTTRCETSPSEMSGDGGVSNSNQNGHLEQANSKELCDDLVAVKMRCVAGGRKSRKPASTFTERKKMFDQL